MPQQTRNQPQREPSRRLGECLKQTDAETWETRCVYHRVVGDVMGSQLPGTQPPNVIRVDNEVFDRIGRRTAVHGMIGAHQPPLKSVLLAYPRAAAPLRHQPARDAKLRIADMAPSLTTPRHYLKRRH